MGLGRSLTAMNAPMEASEAFGAALALDENNKEAEIGLAKSLDLLAMKSGRNPPAKIPPAPVAAMSDDKAPMMRKDDGAIAKSTIDMGQSAMAATDESKGDFELTDDDFGGSSEIETVKVVDNDRGANEKASKVKLDDVLAAIEWKDNQATASRDMSVDNSRVVASAQPADGTMRGAKPVMSDATNATAMPAMAASSYRLQLAAFTAQSSAQSARVRTFEKAKDVLKGVSLVIESGTGGGGKTVYKLRTGPVGDRPQASQLCTKLKSRSIDCFLVVPKGAKKKTAMKRKARSSVMAKAVPPKATTAAPSPPPAPAMKMAKPVAAEPKPMAAKATPAKTDPDGEREERRGYPLGSRQLDGRKRSGGSAREGRRQPRRAADRGQERRRRRAEPR